MIAVVIPYYKIDFFRETLQSLANQTNTKFTVYIGDDASPNIPQKLIEEFSTRIVMRYKRFEKNIGSKSLVSQWYRCLDLIEDEEWVLILGDDDVIGNQVVELFYQEIQQVDTERIDVVRFATQLIDFKGSPLSPIIEHAKIGKATDFLFEGKRSSLSEHFFRIHRLKQIQIVDFPLAWHADNLMILEMTDFNRIYSINDAIIQIRKSDQSISGSSTLGKQKWVASFKFYYHLLVNFKTKFNPLEKKIIVERLEKIYFNNKGRLDWVFKINWAYLRKMDLKQCYSFNRSILLRIINNI